MELWDVYDVNRHIIKNRFIKRGEEDFKEGEFHLVTVGWIYNSKGNLLMQKRSANKVYPLVYANHGGSALKGETSKQAMIREFNEEIGIVLKNEELIFLRSFIEGNMIFDEYVVKKDIRIEDLNLDNNEVESCGWFSFDEIEVLISNNKCFDYKNNNPNGEASFSLIKKYVNKRKSGR